ncbi:MAG TPA: hypothetical protein VL125_16235 [Pelobium sp.]|nr:hypothetical protein [Pelobium sp.]
MVNRLTGAVLKCIKSSEEKARGERDLHDADLRHLEGFQFNRLCPLNEALKVRPTVELDNSNRLKVDIPAFKDVSDLQSPMYSHHCVLRLMLVAVNFREDYYEYISYIDIELKNRVLFEGREWYPEEVLPAGSLAFLSVSLHYFGPSGMAEAPISLNSKECSPAELLAVFKVPLRGEENTAESSERIAEATKRFPLNNYRGGEILKDLSKLRQQGEKKSAKSVADKTGVTEASGFVLPKGKIDVGRA